MSLAGAQVAVKRRAVHRRRREIQRVLEERARLLVLLVAVELPLPPLALHLLASVPEYRARRGPGFQLLTGPEALPLLRELLCMLRLWNLARPPIISLEKEFDLIARLFNLVTRLMKKHEDEALIDECLMLPHKVSS